MNSKYRIVREGYGHAYSATALAILSAAMAAILYAQGLPELALIIAFLSGLFVGMGWGLWGISRSRQIANDVAGLDLWYPLEPPAAGG